jgi:hypothetical protein
LDRLLFALRRALPELGPWLGSTRLSIVLMVVAAQYYLLLAIWSTSSPSHVVQNIAGLIPFWLLYALLLVNTGLCLWNRFPLLRRELARGRWSALGSYLFHGAFFLLAVGFLLSLLARQETKVRVAVGEHYEGRPDQLFSVSRPRPLTGGIPAPGFEVERIHPEFWNDQLLFTSLEAEIRRDGGERLRTRINRPLWVGPGTFLRLSGFGYAPRYELVDRRGVVLNGAFVKMNVFPPGQRDYFVLPDHPHRIYLEVLPDAAVEEGRATTRSLNLTDPAVELQVLRGRLELGRALLRLDEGFEFEGLTLRFPEIRYWGEFSIVRDPGAPVLFLAYAVGLAGLLLKLPIRGSGG